MSDKIKKVTRTKVPTLKQLQNMAYNLRHKFNKSVKIEVTHWNMDHMKEGFFEFNIYIEFFPATETYDSWSELQDKYSELMEG